MIEHDRDKKENAHTPGPEDPASASATREVGSEGGTPGDVELDIDWGAGAAARPGRRGSRPKQAWTKSFATRRVRVAGTPKLSTSSVVERA